MSVLNIAFDIAKIAGGEAAYNAVNNYLSSSPTSSPPQIPMGKKKGVKASPKIERKAGLSKYSDAINAGLAGVVGAVMLASDKMGQSATTASEVNKGELDGLKALNPDSPLLQNQLHLKQSVNDIVDAINSNTIASATFLAPINANLSAISSTLIAISSTLLEISDNYSQQLETADDLPYLDSKSFYDLLDSQHASQLDTTLIKSGEADLVKRLSNEGASFAEIKQAVTEYRKVNIPSSNLLETYNATAGLTQPSPVVNPVTGSTSSNSSGSSASPQKDYSSYFERMASHADSAKVVSEFMQKPQALSDLDGNLVATASPMQMQSIKHASDARHKTDTNNQEYDEDDFNNPFDVMPLLQFAGRASVFDKTSGSPTNLFMPKTMGS